MTNETSICLSITGNEKTKNEIQIRFSMSQVDKKRKIEMGMEFHFTRPKKNGNKNEIWMPFFLCHRKTVGTKVHALKRIWIWLFVFSYHLGKRKWISFFVFAITLKFCHHYEFRFFMTFVNGSETNLEMKEIINQLRYNRFSRNCCRFNTVCDGRTASCSSLFDIKTWLKKILWYFSPGWSREKDGKTNEEV